MSFLRYSMWKISRPWNPSQGSLVTQGHRNRHGSIIRLHIDVPQQPWAYLVPSPRKNGDFSPKSQIFPTHPRVFYAPAEGIYYLVTALGVKKLEWRGYRAEKDVWQYLQPSGYNPPTWQTDRRTDTGRQQRPRLRIRIASRGKNRSTFAKVMGRSQVSCFFYLRGVFRSNFRCSKYFRLFLVCQLHCIVWIEINKVDNSR